ncbi:hypothetical protein Pelo_3764 [Pelomyxa schiedti]|nr:hypothetical protein Pelo_3764 [Pelomyxa schiedti]
MSMSTSQDLPQPTGSSKPLLETAPLSAQLSATQRAFQIQTANTEQVCSWLAPLGMDDDYLKIIKAIKIRGRTLANYSAQQLCGLVVGDAEFIVDEVKDHLARYQESIGASQKPRGMIEQLPRLVGVVPLYSASRLLLEMNLMERISAKTINDSESVSEFLKKKCNFEATCHNNVPNLSEFESNLREFQKKLSKEKRERQDCQPILFCWGAFKTRGSTTELALTKEDFRARNRGFFTGHSLEVVDNAEPAHPGMISSTPSLIKCRFNRYALLSYESAKSEATTAHQSLLINGMHSQTLINEGVLCVDDPIPAL